MRRECKRFIVILAVALIVMTLGTSLASNPYADDIIKSIVYESAVETAESAGYTNYEIIIDDNNNATINVYDTPKSDAAKVEEPAAEEKPQVPELETVQDKAAEKEESTEEYLLGMEALQQGNIVEAMKHFLRSLPNEEAEKEIAENAIDYVDELMFAEDYQTAQAFMIDHPFDGYEQILAECNDHCFLVDLARELEDDWQKSNKDTSTWPDKKIREWYQQLVEDELEYLGKYMLLGFSDPQLANYAYAYIGSLQSQLTGAAYYGEDSEKFNEYWNERGWDIGSRLIYLINKKYGIEISASYNATFKKVLNYGQKQDFVYAVTRMFTEQLSEGIIPFKMPDQNIGYPKNYLAVEPSQKIRNTSGYSLTQYLVNVIFLDESGNEVNHNVLFAHDGKELRDGQLLSSVRDSNYSLFSSFYYQCEFSDSSNAWYTCIVYPTVQYSWDGKNLIASGSMDTDSPAMSLVLLEEVSTFWITHNKSFTPCVEFILRNNGHADLKEASIECVFINKDDNTEWSKEKYFAISSEDAPLRPGQGRSVIVYSAKGYEKKTRKVPDLSVEVYVNGDMIEMIDVDKP